MRASELLEKCEAWPIRIRRRLWANPEDYLVIHKGACWAYLYAPAQLLIGEPTPQAILMATLPGAWVAKEDEARDWEEYAGPLNAKDDHGCASPEAEGEKP